MKPLIPIPEAPMEMTETSPATEVGGLTLGQSIFHESHGYGEVIAINGADITFQERKNKTVTHTAKASDLFTKDSAEHNLATSYYTGGAGEWRRRQGKWASITKNLCRWGEWEGVLKKYNLKRGSMDVLISRFEEEEEWAAHTANLLKLSKLDPVKVDPNEPDPNLPLKVDRTEPPTVHSVYTVAGTPQLNERTPDPAYDEREKNRLAEIAKREGVKPTPHRTMLHLQRRNLDPQMLVRYHAVRENNKGRVKEITDRKIDEAIAEVLALAQPSAPLPTPPDGGSDNAVEAEVRSALRRLNFSDAQINSVELDPKLAFNKLMLIALKQLIPDSEV